MPDTSPASTISPRAHTALVRLLRVAFPHSRFPDGPYERTAAEIIAQLDASLWHRLALTQGLESLDAAAGGDFAGLDDDAALALLREIGDAEFFAFVRGVAVVSIYNDHETWGLLGYEGSSYEEGGYVDRGFDDLDWLPNPRIDEYDGPEKFVEVAADNEVSASGGGDR
ncbi:MAG: hypothetical protein ABIR34_06555 [Marmoricola sp.]